jgi:RHS repeat-associated protein
VAPRPTDVTPATSYSTGVDETGAATISVPIWTPPGRGGVEPRLSLTYSSRAGRGVAGLGFSLSGLSSIERCWKTVASHGALSNSDIPDAFCLNGKHLILDAATGAYFPEGDPGTRVTPFGSTPNPAGFLVETNDGLRTTFGYRSYNGGSPGRIEAPLVALSFVSGEDLVTASSGTPRTVGWLLDHVEDRWGNYMEVEYTRHLKAGDPPQTVEVVPKAIRYTGNVARSLPITREVTFDYITGQQTTLRRVAGVPIVSSLLLTDVRVRAEVRRSDDTTRPARTIMRRYQLKYHAAGATGRKLDQLETVTECFSLSGAGETCALPVEFSWAGLDSPRLPEFTTVGSIAGQGSGTDIPLAGHVSEMLFDIAEGTVGDFNGDGYDDYLLRMPSNVAFIDGGAIAESSWWLALGGPSGLGAPQSVGTLPSVIGSFAKLSPRVFDFNLDGADDLLLVTNGAADSFPRDQRWDIYLSVNSASGVGFASLAVGESLIPSQDPAAPSRSANLVVGDVDGDGVPDVLAPDGPRGEAPLGMNLWFRRGQLTSGTFTLLPGQPLPVPTGRKPLGQWEFHLLDVDGNGALNFLSRVPFVQEESISQDGMSAFLHSFALRELSTGFETQRTFLWARDLTSSIVAERVSGECDEPSGPSPLSRLFIDVDGDGLRDSVSYPTRYLDLCSSTRNWMGSVFTSINQGGTFTAPRHQLALGGTGSTLRIGPALTPENGRFWFDPRTGGYDSYEMVDRDAVLRSLDQGVRVVDFDRDGREDLVLVGHLIDALNVSPTIRNISVALSTGTGFEPWIDTGLQAAFGIHPGAIPAYTRGGGPRSARIGDFNGDGNFDIAMVTPAPLGAAILTHLQNSREPDAVARVSAGPHTAAVLFDYDYLGPRLADRLPATTCVVQASNVNNGISQTLIQRCPKRHGWVVGKVRREANNFDTQVEHLETRYRYGTPVFDTRGRGFLGFASRESTTQGLTETTTRDFSSSLSLSNGGYVYLPSSTLETDVPNLRQSSTTSSVGLIESRSGYRSETSVVDSVTKEGGQQTSRRHAVRAFDEYGNVVEALEEWREPSGAVFSSLRLTHSDNVPDEAQWLTSRFTRQTQESTETSANGSVTGVRTLEFEYAPGRPQIIKFTTEPDAPDETESDNGLKLVVSIAYDNVGNIETLSSDNALETRPTTFTYDELDRQYLVETRNPLSHRWGFYWDAATGLQFAVDDPNQVRERVSFDSFLRPVEGLSGLLEPLGGGASRGGAVVTYRYTKEMRNGTVERRGHWRCADSSSEGQSCQFVDPAGQPTQRTWNHYDGVTSQTIVYDVLGRPVAESLPRNDPRQTPLFLTRTYDRLGRLERESRPGESMTAAPRIQEWSYRPMEVVHTDERGVQTKARMDHKGRLHSTATLDPSSGTPSREVLEEYEYTTFDQLWRRIHPSLNQPMSPAPASLTPETVISYDAVGRVSAIVDPDHGLETRLYSAFGELKQTTDENGAVTTIRRDALGRVTEVLTPPSAHYDANDTGFAYSASFQWDTAPNGVGRIASAMSRDQIQTDFAYDEFGRVKTVAWDGAFQFTHTYDAEGRVKTLEYPSPLGARPFKIRHDYGYTSSPKSIWDVSGAPTLLWHAIAQHASGAIEEQQFGSATRDVRRFDASHRLRYVESRSIRSGAALQRLAYSWEGGFIQSKTDLLTQSREEYTHDFLGRLSTWKVEQNCSTSEWKYNYDDWGNLRRRERLSGPGSDVDASFSTSAQRTLPHAVKELTENGGVQTFSYLPGGQVSFVGGSTTAAIKWAPFGLPTEVSDTWWSTKYSYDAFGARIRTVHRAAQGQSEVINIAGLVEQERFGPGGEGNLELGGVARIMYSVRGPEGLVAQVRRESDKVNEDRVTFIHADHLGSPDTVTDASGLVVERIKHEPFGQRRHPWALAHPVQDTLVADPALGFTGHRAADRFGFTDMKGRLYNAAAAAFLSPDPLHHTGVTGLNRLAYVRNSPVMLVDPSGFDDVEAEPEDEESLKERVIRIYDHGLDARDWAAVRQFLNLEPYTGAGHSKGPLYPTADDQQASQRQAYAAGDSDAAADVRDARNAAGLTSALTEMRPYADAVAAAVPQFALQRLSSGNDSYGDELGVGGYVMSAAPFVGMLKFLRLPKLRFNLLGKSGAGDELRVAAGGAPKLLQAGKLMDHHIFPQQFRKFFQGKGVDIDQFTVRIGETTHLKGVHGRGLGNMPGRWNARWSEFIDANPGATPKDIYQFAGRLMDEFGLSGLPIAPYPR